MIGPWSYRSAYFTAPDALDTPDCDACGGGTVADPDALGGLSCPTCEARADRHRERGDSLRRTARARRGYARRAGLVATDRERRGAVILAAVSHPDFLTAPETAP